MLVTVAGTKQKVVMIEAGANEVEESVMLEGIKFAHKHIIELCDFISGIQAEIGKEKFTYESHDVDHDLYDAIKNMALRSYSMLLIQTTKMFVMKESVKLQMKLSLLLKNSSRHKRANRRNSLQNAKGNRSCMACSGQTC